MIGKACESAAGAFRRREAGRVGRPLITPYAFSDHSVRWRWVCGSTVPEITIGCSDMGGDVMKHPWTAVASVIMALILSDSGQARSFNDPRSEKNDAIDKEAANEFPDQACHSRSLASTGAATPRNEHTLVVRWMGYSNFELVYGGHILLLDAYYDRGSVYTFKAAAQRNSHRPWPLRSYVRCGLRRRT